MSTLQNNYTSRDFESIYADLLAAVKQLTTRWDPSESNESDPGVVLLKLGALLADKANYAVDQGLLQLFPTTVSQRPAAEVLFESLGYNMRWYQSAYAPLEISYGGSLSEGESIRLPKYDTKVTSDDGKFVFSLVEDVSFDGGAQGFQRVASVSAVEGAVRLLTLGGDSVITLHHLDNYNRVYFPEQMVAQNGVFVWGEKEGSEQWTQVDSLQSQPSLARVYKFGTSRAGSCYLEFPTEVASIIDTGLKIYYTVSTGAAGNVNANTLTKFYSEPLITSRGFDDREFTYAEDDFKILNPSGTTGGSDPQTIDSAYQEYLRIMGTFNTLVSERDYEAYIYRMPGPVNKYWVSNIRVNDRTDDLTWSTYVKVLGDQGATEDQLQVASENVPRQTSQGDTVDVPEDRIKPYEIRFRPLEYVENLISADRYNETFDVDPSRGRLMGELQSAAVSMISLQEKPIKEGEGYLILNKYTVNGVLYTRKPVSDTEGEELLNKVRVALFKKFNAREVSFGVPVEWSDVRDTIEGADSNIDHVVLSDLVYTPYMLHLGRGGTSELTLLGDWYKPLPDSGGDTRPEGRRREELLARMVVSGRLQLFDFESGFSIQYGTRPAQGCVDSLGANPSNIGPLHELVSITTESVYPASAGSPSAIKGIVRSGDNIIFEAPNFITEVSYASYVKWQANNTGGGIDIKAGQIYQIPETLTLTLADTTIPSGAFIKPSFEWAIGTGNSDAKYLGVDETVDVVRPNEQSFQPNTINCMWFRDQGANVLFSPEETTIVLSQGQWFVYKTPTSAALNFLGAGTKIERSSEGSQVAQRFDISVEELQAQGSAYIASSVWYQPVEELTFTEQEIITLGQGTSFEVALKSDSQLDNTPKTLETGKYQAPGESEPTTLAPRPENYGWSVRSRLNIAASPSVPMVLRQGQSMKIRYRVHSKSDEGETTTERDVQLTGSNDVENQTNIRFSQGFVLVGGANVDLGVTNVLTGETTYPISAYPYAAGIAPSFFPTSQGVYSFYGMKLWQVKVDGDKVALNMEATGTVSTKNSEGEKVSIDIKWKARFRIQAGFASESKSVSSYTIDVVASNTEPVALYYGEYRDIDGAPASLVSDEEWEDWDISLTKNGKNRLFTKMKSGLSYSSFGLYRATLEDGSFAIADDPFFVYDGNAIKVVEQAEESTDAAVFTARLRAPYWKDYTSLIPVTAIQALDESDVTFVDISSRGTDDVFGKKLDSVSLLKGSGKWHTIQVNLEEDSPKEPTVIVSFQGNLTAVEKDSTYTLNIGGIPLLSGSAPVQVAQFKPSVVYSSSQEEKEIGATGVTKAQVKAYIQDQFDKYNLAHTPAVQELMQDSLSAAWSPLASSSLWDQKNLLNPYTLPCLDTGRSSLTIANASRKRGM